MIRVQFFPFRELIPLCPWGLNWRDGNFGDSGLQPQLPTKAGEIHTLKAPLFAEQLQPESRDYYRFSGSLTTPPCSEGVRWLVMKQPVEVSKAQIDAFKAVMLHPNNRPVQPLNGRVILQ
jgi:carbonic anhydrase